MPDFKIRVIVDTTRAVRGTRTVERNLNRVESSANRLNRTIRRAFAGFGAFVAIRELTRLADAFNTINNRLRVVTEGNQELVRSYTALLNISQETRSGFQNTVQLYSRLAISSRELGVSQRTLLQFTKSLNQAIIISGASSQEANNALIQLSQGLASGALRGDELRSVLEQLPVVADVIAKRLGVTRGELRELGADGKILSQEIIAAFKDAREELEDRFGKTVATIGQSLTVLNNSMINFIGQFDDAINGTEALTSAIIALSNAFDVLAVNADTVAIVLATLGVLLLASFGAPLVAAIGVAISQIIALEVALGAATTRAALLSALLKRFALINPFTAMVVALGAITALLSTIETQTERISRIFSNLDSVIDNVRQAYEKVGGELSKINDELTDLSLTQILLDQEEAAQALEDQLGILSARIAGLAFRSGADPTLLRELILISDQVRKGTIEFEVLQDRLDEIGQSEERLRPLVSEILDLVSGATSLNNQLERFGSLINVLRGEGTSTDVKVLDLETTDTTTSRATNEEKKRLEKRVELLARVNRELEQERILLGLSEEQREIELRLFRIKEQFLRNQTPLTREETAAIRAQTEALQDLEQALLVVEDVASTVFDGIGNALDEFIRTGKFNFSDFARSLIADLAKIAAQAFLLGPIIKGITGVAAGGNFLSSFTAASPSFAALPGFQTGGSVVGGTGGPDSQLLVTRVSPGERVDFTPQGQNPKGRRDGMIVNFNISTPDADSFRKSETQVAAIATRALGRGRRNL